MFRGDNGRIRRTRWLWIGALVVLVTLSVVAVQQSVTVRAQWKVLPYQTLRLDGGTDAASVSYSIPEPTALDVARGFIEDEHAVQLRVVSNTPWKIQVRVERGDDTGLDVLARRHGGSYAPLTEAAQILASGPHGSYDVGVDYRIPLGDDSDAWDEAAIDVVYTIMSE